MSKKLYEKKETIIPHEKEENKTAISTHKLFDLRGTLFMNWRINK